MLVRSGGFTRSSLLARIASLSLTLSALGCADGDATRNDPGNTSTGATSGAGGAAGDATNGGESPVSGGHAGGGAGEAQGGAGGSESECAEDGDCVPLGECYTAACEAGACVGSVRSRGSTCKDGFCNGFARCLACLDDAPGVERDRGCTEDSPLCAETDSEPSCVACEQDADCDDENPCSADRCTDARCEHTGFPRGTSCGAGVCNGESGAESCVPCFEDPAIGRDPGCTSDRPRCDTSTTPPRCTGCASGGDCDDRNECTADGCDRGVCSRATLVSGTPCAGGYCNGVSGSEICIPKQCENDASCDDHVACTTEVCESTYLCTYTTDDSQCPDSGDVCRPNVCTVGIGCQEIDVSRRLQLLANGDFEAGNAEWTEMSTSYPQVIYLVDYVPTLRAHTEPYIAWLGGGEGPVDEHNTLTQRVNVPASSVGLELSFFYQIWADDLPDDQNHLRVAVRAPDASGSPEELVTFHNQDETRVWKRFTASLDVARWAGAEVLLEFEGAGVDGYTAFFVDSVSLTATVCEQP